jgi:hypothetical protein
MKKRQTLSELATAQTRSAQAFENLRDDPDTADEIRSMSPTDFAEWRGIEVISNPSKRSENNMATSKSAAAAVKIIELEETNSTLTEENERLRSLLASFADTIDEELGLDEDEDEETDGEEDDDEIEDDEEEGEGDEDE